MPETEQDKATTVADWRDKVDGKLESLLKRPALTPQESEAIIELTRSLPGLMKEAHTLRIELEGIRRL